jgi:hypothetical protein
MASGRERSIRTIVECRGRADRLIRATGASPGEAGKPRRSTATRTLRSARGAGRLDSHHGKTACLCTARPGCEHSQLPHSVLLSITVPHQLADDSHAAVSRHPRQFPPADVRQAVEEIEVIRGRCRRMLRTGIGVVWRYALDARSVGVSRSGCRSRRGVMASASGPTSPASPNALRVDTGPAVALPIRSVGIQGILEGPIIDGHACFAISGTPVRLPYGYGARLDAEGRLILLDPSSAPVARVGDVVASGASWHEAPLAESPQSPCFAPGQEVWGLVEPVEKWSWPTDD